MNTSTASERPNTGKRLAVGVSWSVAGAMLSNGLVFVASFPVARILGQKTFGELALVQGTVGMFAALASFGLGVATTKSVAEYRSNSPDRIVHVTTAAMFLAMFSGGLTGAALYTFSGILAENTLAAPHLADAIRIGAGLLLLGAIESVAIGTLAGLEDFRAITCVGIVKGILACPCLAGGALLGGLEGVVWGLVVSGLASAVLYSISLPKRIQATAFAFDLRRCIAEWKLLPSSALPVCLSTITVAVAEWAALAVFANESRGYEELGTFTAVNRFFSLVMLATTLINRPLMPIISEQLGRGARSEAVQTVGTALRLTAMTVVPLVVIVSVGSPLVMSFYGEEFTSEWPTLVIALCSAGIAALTAPLGRWFIASDQAWTNACFFLVWAGFMLLLANLLVEWGAFGLVVSRGVAYGLRAALMAGVIFFQSGRPGNE